MECLTGWRQWFGFYNAPRVNESGEGAAEADATEVEAAETEIAKEPAEATAIAASAVEEQAAVAAKDVIFGSNSCLLFHSTCGD